MSLSIESFKPSAIVVGAGVGGLYAAYLLSNKNYDVTIIEKQGRVGGLVETLCVDGGCFELGPSHHLEHHTLFRELLIKFGENIETAFSPPSDVFVDGNKIDVNDVETSLFQKCVVDEQKFIDCNDASGSNATSLPWWDELKHFRKKDANLSTEDGKAFRVEGGYQNALQKVAKNLVTKGVKILTGTIVTAFKNNEVTTCDATLSASVVVFAVPPAALQALGVQDDNPKRHCGRKSIRVFARVCVEEDDAKKTLKEVFEKIKGKHIVSEKALFRWAIALTPSMYMISYTDADRAEAVEGVIKEDKIQIWHSFVEHICEHHVTSKDLIVFVKSLIPELHYRHYYEGFAYHTDESTTPDEIRTGPFLVGEAYGPPELRAWMEGACASAAAVVKNIVSL